MGNNRNITVERYKFWVEQLRHEDAVLWRICTVFTLPLTVLVAFLLTAAFRVGETTISDPAILATAIVGLVLSVLWFLACGRSLSIFDTRKKQVEKLAEDCPDWNLFKKNPRGWVRIRTSVLVLVVAFIVIHLYIIYIIGLVLFSSCSY